MKNRSFIILASLLAINFTGMAQAGKKLTGSWEGKLNVGVELRIVFHIKANDHGGLTATADSPDQSAFGLKCDTVIVSGADSVQIQMNALNAGFAGRLVSDSVITGSFTQRMVVPLSLKKVDKPSVRVRPQTPKTPFPYKSEDIEYDNADKSLHYGATITIPEGKGPFPAAVLITGSGPQNRNEEMMGHQPFAVLADALTRNGFVVLRVDDRGVGKSTGVFSQATSADFASDVNTSLDYLLARPEVNKKKTGIIGHSEGGMIAPVVAAKRKDIDFIVLLAAPGIRIDELMAQQNAAILRSIGISQPAVDAYIPFYKQLMNKISTSPDSAAAAVDAGILFQQWVADTDPALLKEVGFDTEEVRKNAVSRFVGEFSGKWFKYFLAFDPGPYLQKLNTKVLALNGEKDIQVIASPNLAGIEAALKKSKTRNYTVKALPGLNHLFQTCTLCTIAEYGLLEETISSVVLEEIKEWLNKNVK